MIRIKKSALVSYKTKKAGFEDSMIKMIDKY
jgi:hypothetical protein